MISSNDAHSDPGPELIVTPTNVTVEVGDAVLLPCQATGVPHPKLVWHSQKTGKINNDPGEYLALFWHSDTGG